jgi:hypothetical protein
VTPDGLVQVHLLELPVPLAAKAREHFEGLTREFVLMSASSGDDQHVPARLVQLVDNLTARFGGTNTDADQRLDDAIDAGAATLADHVLELPPEAAAGARALGDMLEEVDEYCRQGEHLLTLATPADCVTYRHWYLAQVADQLEGAEPVSWPEFHLARG